MLPGGTNNDERTREDRATQPMDAGWLSFAKTMPQCPVLLIVLAPINVLITLKSYQNGLLSLYKLYFLQCVSSIAIGAISTGARKKVLLAPVLEEMFY